MAIGFGNWRGLPELGITEFFGGKKGSVATSKKFPVNRQSVQQVAGAAYRGNAVNPVQTSNLLSRAPTAGRTPTPGTSSTTRGGGGGGEDRGGSNRPTAPDVSGAENQLRGDISSGWDSYISSLDDQFTGLAGQRTAQEGIAGSQYQQGLNSLGLQREQGLQSLEQNRASAEQNQTRNLRDISENIRNAFMAGNIYLGSRGAGDSSSANQYSYALNKMGTQQRSGVMNETATILADIDARSNDLNNIYNTEVNNLEQGKNQQMQEIASWFSDAQNQLAGLKSQGQLGKSQDLASLSKNVLDRAIAEVNQINQYVLNKRQMLDQWAMGMSDNINSLKSNLEATSRFNPQLPQASNIFASPSVENPSNTRAYGGGLFDDERAPNRLFG